MTLEEQKRQIRARTRELVREARRLYEKKLPTPKLTFFSGDDETVGYQIGLNEIGYNLDYMAEDWESFYRLIPPHEVAHLVQTNLKPLSRQHGKFWKAVCRELGGDGESRWQPSDTFSDDTKGEAE